MQKNTKKAKRITKRTQLRVRTGVKSGDWADDCVFECRDWCTSIGGHDAGFECSCNMLGGGVQKYPNH